MWLAIFFVVIGLAILLVGGDIFVRGASSMAKKLNVSALVIGLTIVAFGTSAPELVVNFFSALKGSSDIALGNIIGSNIANTLLVLGVAAIIYPISVKKGTVWKEIPFGVLTVFVLYVLINDIFFGGSTKNILTVGDGIILVSFFLIFLYYTYGLTKVKGEHNNEVDTYGWTISISFILGGSICLFVGGKILVDNAVILARMAGLSELLIGLTITAVGTSLPEFITSAIAAYRRQVDLAIGNVIGSNIFNILWVLGVTSIIKPMEVQETANIDILFTLGSAVLLFFVMFIGGKHGKHTLRRIEGVLFVLLYLGYIGFVIMRG
ncbi:MAG: sodium:proton exchanger [Candidatus Magasanikbacteria bacterium CG_4_10_14_0_2_um_filter_37_12]|uniref:Sodium:proton exchanger n=1 Tax=Candidatus Magasanikbacteria bacterium CG_4_10_14_0_2_um_filter_37_12 TaxID=1974637 RepID=A0A2M7V724_9BACT|nr:MAG: sodium:proton exchanger [Candidatus Magasanikbacteria bacterium CG_4_10_14_0_2_um_filter_37_12]